jgi:hypothetical protein
VEEEKGGRGEEKGVRRRERCQEKRKVSGTFFLVRNDAVDPHPTGY